MTDLLPKCHCAESRCLRILLKEANVEVAGYKAQVAGQAEYIGHLLTEIADLKERISEFVK